MANLVKKLSKKQKDKIQKFLTARFTKLKDLREPLDTEIQEEIDIYNNKDKYVDNKEDWEEKRKTFNMYTIVQTIYARLDETFFGSDNYLRIYIEDEKLKNIEKEVQQFIQNKLDKIKLRDRARDFLEPGLISRTSWLQLIPIIKNGELEEVDFGVYKWFDVWFDTKAKKVDDTDVFIKKIVKLFKIKQNEKVYFNLDKIEETTPPDDIKENQIYKAKHGKDYNIEKTVYYDPDGNSTIDEVELLEWYGIYDISDNPDKPDFKDVIFVLANRNLLIRAETIELDTKKKKLLFPIRPLRQANSLIGKSIPQLTKDSQYELNEIKSLRMQNFKTLIKLLFKYKRDSGIDFDELTVEAENAIGYDDDPKDIDTFDVPNLIREASAMIGELTQDMQQTTGAVDYLMGTSAGRGITETASGIRQITEQAMYKFTMIAINVYFDLLDFISYLIILYTRYGKKKMILKNVELDKLAKISIEDLEDSSTFDIALNNIAMRRDVERSQYINAINVILGILGQVGGNPKELLRQTMERLNMENIDEILKLPPEEEQIIQQLLPIIKQNPQVIQMLLQMVEQAGKGEMQNASLMAAPQAMGKAMPEETALNENTERRR